MDRFIVRARILFGILLVVAIGVSIFAFAFAIDEVLAIRILLLSGAAATIPALVALLHGLDRRAQWAPSSAEMVCVMLLISGLVRVGVDLTQQRVSIPLEAIGAAIVLAARPPRDTWPIVGPADVWPRRLIVGLFAVALLGAFLTLPLQTLS